jgi:homoserine dehydrogenase
MKDEKEYNSPLFHPSSLIPHPFRVALLGLGNVARAFARYIENRNLPIQIVALADSTGGVFVSSNDQARRVIALKESGSTIAEIAPADVIQDAKSFIDLLPEAGAHLLIESLPTNLSSGQPALDLIGSALARGIHVVTVDKGPLVHGLSELKTAARAAGSLVGFSGTTGVAAPDDIQASRVLEIRGVLNGTTNYILTEMQERGLSFNQALARAQADGIAEPDPSLDIEGWDTAAKILILAKDLMGATARIDEVSRIGISAEIKSLIQTARDRNALVRLVGRARIHQGRVRVSVAPKIVPVDSPFHSVSGTSKAALFRTEEKGEVIAFARSGRDAISQIILDDIQKIASREGRE